LVEPTSHGFAGWFNERGQKRLFAAGRCGRSNAMRNEFLRMERQCLELAEGTTSSEARAALEAMAADFRSRADSQPTPSRTWWWLRIPERRQTSAVILAALAIYAIYLPTALMLSKPVPIGPPGAVLRLAKCSKGEGFLYFCPAYSLRDMEDDVPTAQRSPVLVYEDDKPLGPGHSRHHDVQWIGLGRYSHWKNLGLLISTSDNSDPNTNGRNYWAVLPK
jgi:hypothetical protein